VLTGRADWLEVTRTVANRTGLNIAAHRVTDHEARWRDVVGIGEEGALLVRPDGFVAWRATELPDNPTADLEAAVLRILARSPIKEVPQPAHAM
jgi:putative polyketide hydroxylase